MKGKPRSFIPAVLFILIISSCAVKDTHQTKSVFSERQDRVTAFINVNLVPMTGQKVIKNQNVLVKGTKIIKIGPSNKVEIPENATVIDGTGAYLMPGLADMHMHTNENWLSEAWPVSPLRLYLANGVTTIRCFGPLGKSPDYVLGWRRKIQEGRLSGPTIYTSGRILFGPVNNPGKEVSRQKAEGFDFIKLYSYLSKEEFHEVMATARKTGMYTTGHIPFQVGLDGVLAEGIDEIAHVEELMWEHVEFDRNKDLKGRAWMSYVALIAFQQFRASLNLDIPAFRQKYQERISQIAGKVRSANIPVCTTLFLDEVIVQKLFKPEEFLARPDIKFMPSWYIDAFKKGNEKHQVQFKGGENFAPFKYLLDRTMLVEFHKSGVRLILGTDAGGGGMGIVPGFSIHDELRVLTENGFTPYEAIATGTVNASKIVEAMTGTDDFGTIEKGKRADLILINKNPLEDVAHIKDLRGTMAAGRWYEKAELEKMIIPSISIIGAIHHVLEPGNRHKTYIEIIVGKNFTSNLPDAINTITVTGPEGILPIRTNDYIYFPRSRSYWVSLPELPETGTYAFKVTSGKRNGSATDVQSVIKTIPIPDVNTMSPASGAKIRSNAPTFSWSSAKTGTQLYYRLEIFKQHGGRIYSTGRVKDMLSHTIPEGILKPGQRYRWRIRVMDHGEWVKVQNRSQSDWMSFTVAPSLE